MERIVLNKSNNGLQSVSNVNLNNSFDNSSRKVAFPILRSFIVSLISSAVKLLLRSLLGTETPSSVGRAPLTYFENWEFASHSAGGQRSDWKCLYHFQGSMHDRLSSLGRMMRVTSAQKRLGSLCSSSANRLSFFSCAIFFALYIAFRYFFFSII